MAAAVCADLAASGLLLHQAQILATHNSYHLATPTYNYSWPPLTEQLDAGARGFELDLYFDAAMASRAGSLEGPHFMPGDEFRVIHVPGLDDISTCETLYECLYEVRAWSNMHPRHFPLFFQLELMGAVAHLDEANGCMMADIEPTVACVIENCVGELPADLVDCLTSNCLVHAFAAYTANPACADLAACLTDVTGELDQEVALDHDAIMDGVSHCVANPSGGYTAVDFNETGAAAALATIANAIDYVFPAERRVGPDEACGDGWALAWPGGEVCGAPTWPTVDASRGKVIFWLTQMSGWTSAVEGALGTAANQGFFIEGQEGAIWKDDDLDGTSTDAHIQAAILVRTRADTWDLGADGARRANALASGAHVLSTDFMPPLQTFGPEAFVADLPTSSPYFWPAGGSPVRCNVVTAAADCAATQLEDPATLACGAPTTTTASPPTDDDGAPCVNPSTLRGIAWMFVFRRRILQL